jgi:amino acid transporter
MTDTLTEQKPEVFTRSASGLVRVMSPWSAMMYNILTMGVIFPWIFFWAPLAFPGCSVWLACVLGAVVELPIALGYCWLASAMPRSGGDYVFQSRVLGSAVGFTVCFSTIMVLATTWLALAGWLVANLGVAPLLLGLGVHYHSTGLINAGIWCQSRLGVTIVSFIALVGMFGLLVSGFRHYVRLQYVIFWSLVIMIVILVVQFLRTSPAEFATAVNQFSKAIGGNSNYYTWIQKDVASTGFNVKPAFALGATLLAAPIAWTGTMWAAWGVQQGGEIKGARFLKNQVRMIVGALAFVGAAMALIAWAEQHAVGTGFFNAVAASYYGGVSASGQGVGHLLPFPGNFAIVISAGSPILIVVVGAAFFLSAWQIVANNDIGASRIWVAFSLDRMMPSWCGRVSERLKTPVNALTIVLVESFFVTILYNYASWYTALTLGVTAAGGLVFLGGSTAAALLPYRAKDIYLGSPGARYRILGIPLVTVFGAIGICLTVAMEIALLTNRGYGLVGWKTDTYMAGTFVIVFIYYWINREYRKSRGIDMSHTFASVPPE